MIGCIDHYFPIGIRGSLKMATIFCLFEGCFSIGTRYKICCVIVLLQEKITIFWLLALKSSIFLLFAAVPPNNSTDYKYQTYCVLNRYPKQLWLKRHTSKYFKFLNSF